MLEEGEVLMDMEVDEVVVESDFTLGVKSASPIKNLVITTALSRPPPVINDRDSPSHSSSGDGERPCAKRWKPVSVLSVTVCCSISLEQYTCQCFIFILYVKFLLT